MNRRQMIAALAGTTALRGPANITELDRHLLSFGRPTLGGEQQNHAADAYGHGGYEPRMDALAFQESKA